MRKSWLMSLLFFMSVVLMYLIWHFMSPDLFKSSASEDSDRAIRNRLDTLRLMEVQFHTVNGKYAGTFKELFDFIKTDSMPFDSLSKTPGVPAYMPVFGRIPLNIEKYQLVPPLDTDTFLIFAGLINRSGREQPVFEIREPYGNDNREVYKVGDKYNTITNGNWK